ncbi:MAG: tail fiber protein [Thermoleophilaceae bacterium]|nr:tail fiber protein [Thermoleophilaceae bacterium]
MIEDLIKGPSTGGELFRGYISRAPATAADGVFVVVPEFSGDHEFGPSPWPTRGFDLPNAGDQCLAHVDTRGGCWVVAWQEPLVIAPIAPEILPGVIQMYAGPTAPAGFLFCKGTSELRTAYPALYNVIGTTYGSVDSTHFTLPDLGGRVPVGVEGAVNRLSTNDALGAAGGAETHRHDWKFAQFDKDYGPSGPGAGMYGDSASNKAGAYRYSTGAYQSSIPDGVSVTQNAQTGGVVSTVIGRYATTGDTDLATTLQPYQVVNFIIKS